MRTSPVRKAGGPKTRKSDEFIVLDVERRQACIEHENGTYRKGRWQEGRFDPQCLSCSFQGPTIWAQTSCREEILGELLYDNGRVHGRVHDGVFVARSRYNPSPEMLDHTIGLLQMIFLKEPRIVPFTPPAEQAYYYHPRIVRAGPFFHALLGIHREAVCWSMEEIQIVGPRTMRSILSNGEVETAWEIFHRMKDNLFSLIRDINNPNLFVKALDEDTLVPSEDWTWGQLEEQERRF